MHTRAYIPLCRNPRQLLGRSLRIAGALGSVAVSIFLDTRSGKVEANMRQRAVQLREALTSLGPTFVKLGQALSTRPDLCPPVYLEELSFLQVRRVQLVASLSSRVVETWEEVLRAI